MSLIDEMMTPCVVMEKTHVPDGEGGLVTTWREGASVDIAITTDTSIRGQVADALKNTATYTLVFKKDIPLSYYDVVKRVADGRTFRIISDDTDGNFPDVASNIINPYKRVTAERWELT